jgi:arylsulfatase A-like enzyme
MPSPDLFLLICDTARADAFRPWDGPVPTPSMERLAREGVVYRQAVSQGPWTVPSTASMFTGLLPTEHGITGECLGWQGSRPSGSARAVEAYKGAWLPETLQERGYRTFAAVCNPWIGTWGGYGRGFDRFVDVRARMRRVKTRPGKVLRRTRQMGSRRGMGGKQAVEHFGRWTADTGPADAPWFAFVNLMEVHAPYDPPPRFHPLLHSRRPGSKGRGRRPALPRFLYDQLRQKGNLRGIQEAGFVATLRSLYFASARYEDWLIGRFIQVIEERGRPALVIVTADHGENLGEHGLIGHHSSLSEQLVNVPLLLWGHRLENFGRAQVDDPVSLLGLMATLQAAADGDVRALSPNGPVVSEYESTVWQFGKREHGRPPEIRRRMRQAQGPGERAVPGLVRRAGMAAREGSLKYLAVDGGEEVLFDLSADRGEEHDLSGARPEALERFRPLREQWEKRRAGQPEYEVGEAAEQEIVEHLEMLGYIE